MTLKQRLGKVIFSHLPITRFLFDQLRAEANGKLRGIENSVSPAQRARLRKLRGSRDLLVNVACGPDILPGFVNIDLLKTSPEVLGWDCRRSLPLADQTAAGIKVEQFVEHLETREELPAFLRDCVRILQPGGVLRIIVPDAERHLQAYCRGDLSGFRELAVPDPFPEDLPTRMDIINHIFHQWHEHRWAYDFETLAHRLRAAGFSDIRKMSYGRSLIAALANDREQHAPYSLYVEAVKTPGTITSRSSV